MMNRRNKAITWSAALCGLALSLMTPAALGHGNNPKGPYLGITDPNDPFEIPGGLNVFNWPPADDGTNQMTAGPWLDWRGSTNDVPRETVLRWSALERLADLDPGGDATIGIGAADMLPTSSLGGTPAINVPRSAPAGGAIPTPGTLGLLAVGALVLRRRRRR
jgi:MYXO-CTERM domain-containing protein